jgi:hypothetical protein
MPDQAGCNKLPCGTYACRCQLVDDPEYIAAIWHMDEWPRLADGDVPDDLLPLHVQVAQLKGGRAGCFRVSWHIRWLAAIQA